MDHIGTTSPEHDRVRHVLGMMTGTSIDGIDAALVRITSCGLAMHAEYVTHISRPIGGAFTRDLRRAAAQEPMTASELATLAWNFGHRHAEVAAELMASVATTPRDGATKGTMQLDCIAVHGQTVYHAPPISWQLVNVSPIVERMRCPVVFDFRQADLAAGGQGAPITPLADWIFFRSAERTRAIVNLGGFCNITILKGGAALEPDLEHVLGCDVCACNQLLDAVARQALGIPFDIDGRAAGTGLADRDSFQSLYDILSRQATGGRSLGTGDEALQWVQVNLKTLSANDLAATAVLAVAEVIARTLAPHAPEEIYLAGGGAKHIPLVRLLADRARSPVGNVERLGVPAEAREAAGMAALGALCADGVPVTLPHVTGCEAPAPLAGVWAVPAGRRSTPAYSTNARRVVQTL